MSDIYCLRPRSIHRTWFSIDTAAQWLGSDPMDALIAWTQVLYAHWRGPKNQHKEGDKKREQQQQQQKSISVFFVYISYFLASCHVLPVSWNLDQQNTA
uniref:Uncharacterized protein n=1 Tax=Arundo donax TaxID=35708 RepID=A0A0A8ZMW1_ARUDO